MIVNVFIRYFSLLPYNIIYYYKHIGVLDILKFKVFNVIFTYKWVRNSIWNFSIYEYKFHIWFFFFNLKLILFSGYCRLFSIRIIFSVPGRCLRYYRASSVISYLFPYHSLGNAPSSLLSREKNIFLRLIPHVFPYLRLKSISLHPGSVIDFFLIF